MKTVILYFAFLITCIPVSLAQIGINTENPRHLFHLDGASNNPLIGNVSALQASDDVIMTTTGALGIGTNVVGDDVKLKIGQGGAFRLKDGLEGDRRVLVSNAAGDASWNTIASSWFAYLAGGEYVYPHLNAANQPNLLNEVISFSISDISSPTQGSVTPAPGSGLTQSGAMVVPFNGFYKITISLWCINRIPNPQGNTNFIPYLNLITVRSNGVNVFQPHSTGVPRNSFGQEPSYTSIIRLNANSELTFELFAGPLYVTHAVNVTAVVEFIVAA